MQTQENESSSKPALAAIAKVPDSQSASVPAPSIAATTSQSGQPSTSSQPNPSDTSPAEGLTNKPEAASSDDTKAEVTPTTPTISKSAQLQAQIQALASLQSRTTNLRSIPAHLLIFHSQSPLVSLDGLADLGMSLSGGTNTDGASTKVQGMGSQAHTAFRMLSEARDELLKSATQDALKMVRESEARDKSGIKLLGRRERKRRRIASADSPAPFPSFQLQTNNVFPPLHQKSRNVSNLEDISNFIREHNKARAELESGTENPGTRLGIWKQSRPRLGTPRTVSDPLIVRVAIHDVAIVFVKLTCRRTDDGNGSGQPVIEGVVALGPREKKSPHSHSDFTVYQKLTQQITRMVEKEPTVSFPQLVDFLVSYEDLFVAQCSICGRVLSQEGHVPPVARVWTSNPSIGDEGQGRWAARHVSCLHA